MILKMGIDSGIPAFKELMDIAVPDMTLKNVNEALGRLESRLIKTFMDFILFVEEKWVLLFMVFF